jgi:regulator of protease activity HflC (stomatin/prohibitin superfamily)
LGKITLDKTFEERETLNLAIVASINGAAEAWGLQCLRYEIKDITPPAGVCALHVGDCLFVCLFSGR